MNDTGDIVAEVRYGKGRSLAWFAGVAVGLFWFVLLVETGRTSSVTAAVIGVASCLVLTPILVIPTYGTTRIGTVAIQHRNAFAIPSTLLWETIRCIEFRIDDRGNRAVAIKSQDHEIFVADHPDKAGFPAAVLALAELAAERDIPVVPQLDSDQWAEWKRWASRTEPGATVVRRTR